MVTLAAVAKSMPTAEAFSTAAGQKDHPGRSCCRKRSRHSAAVFPAPKCPLNERNKQNWRPKPDAQTISGQWQLSAQSAHHGSAPQVGTSRTGRQLGGKLEGKCQFFVLWEDVVDLRTRHANTKLTCHSCATPCLEKADH